MKKLFISMAVVASSLISFNASADFKQVMRSDVNSIISMNMIPTQFQSVIIDVTDLDDQKMEIATNTLKKFSSYNGNVDSFIQSYQPTFTKLDLNISAKGSQMMSIADLNKKQRDSKTSTFMVDKKGQYASYSISYKDEGEDFTAKGSVNLGQNKLIDQDGYLILVSYRNL